MKCHDRPETEVTIFRLAISETYRVTSANELKWQGAYIPYLAITSLCSHSQSEQTHQQIP